jgi:hypothetical protein
MQDQLVTSLTDRKTHPAAVVQDSALQGDHRAPPTVAAGDESPMNSRECRVQRAFQGLVALAWSSRYPMNGPQPHGRTGAGGAQRQEKGRTLLLIGVPRIRVNKCERKAGDIRGDPRHIMESDVA